MTDTDKQAADQPKADSASTDKSAADKPKADTASTDKPADDQPKADTAPVEEPKSDQSAPASAGGGDQSAGTDQHGRQLYEVDCSSCGNKAQVPFKPSGGRPVYCRDCYMNQRNDRGPRRQF